MKQERGESEAPAGPQIVRGTAVDWSRIIFGVRSPLRGLEFLVRLSQGCAALALGYYPWLPPGADCVGAWGELGGRERIAWARTGFSSTLEGCGSIDIQVTVLARF